MELLLHLHPALSALPPSFAFGAVGLEVYIIVSGRQQLRIVAEIFLLLALAGFVCAFGSGYIAADLANKTGGADPALVASHHTVGRLGLITMVVTAAFVWLEKNAADATKGALRSGYRVLLLVTAVLTAITCYRGGTLVFVHGIGVRHELRGSADKNGG